MRLYALIGRIVYPILLPLMRIVLKRTERAYVLIEYRGEHMFVKNWLARNTWRLPGGGVKQSEDPKKAAIREVYEEVGVVVEESELSLVGRVMVASDKLGYPMYVYKAVLDDRPQLKINKWEVIDFVWAKTIPEPAFDEVKELLDAR